MCTTFTLLSSGIDSDPVTRSAATTGPARGRARTGATAGARQALASGHYPMLRQKWRPFSVLRTTYFWATVLKNTPICK